MASGHVRDLPAIAAGLTRWISDHGDLVPGGAPGGGQGVLPLPISALTHATGGLANETIIVELGPDHPGVAVRLPPLEPTFADYDLATQAAVQQAVAVAGIPAPAPAVAVAEMEWIGTSFLVMPRVHGHIPGPAPVFDQWIMGGTEADQRAIHNGMIETLAAVHAVDFAAHGLDRLLLGPGVSAALDQWGAYVAWAGGDAPLPALTRALAWCREHQPPDGDPDGPRPALLWGDPRLGNLVFDDHLAVHAVLDWELASVGPAEMDLGWYFGLDAMMDELFGRRVPGFPARDEALAHYEELSGRTVTNLAWHEIFALVRALAINDRQQRVAAAAGRRYVGGDQGAEGREDPLVRVLLARTAAFGATGATP